MQVKMCEDEGMHIGHYFTNVESSKLHQGRCFNSHTATHEGLPLSDFFPVRDKAHCRIRSEETWVTKKEKAVLHREASVYRYLPPCLLRNFNELSREVPNISGQFSPPDDRSNTQILLKMDPDKPAPLYYEVSPLTVRMLKLIGLLYCVIRLCLDFKLIRVWDLSVSKLLVHRARRFLQ